MQPSNPEDKLIRALVWIDLQGWSFNPAKPDGIVFKSQSKKRAAITVKANDREGFGIYKGCSVTARKNVYASEEIHQLIETYQRNGWQDSDFSNMPVNLQSYISEIRKELLSDVSRAFSLMAWRQNLPSFKLGHSTFYFGTTKPVGPVPKEKTRQIFKIDRRDRWSEYSRNFKSIWKTQTLAQPLAHELLREARNIAFASPRSSLLMCCAALETGIKTHCKSISPDTEWLLSNSPSPPVFKILKNFIPSLHIGLGRNMAFWDKFVKTHNKRVQQLIELRNKISHGAEAPFDQETLSQFLESSEEILYMLDFLCGNEWANGHIQAQISDDQNIKHPKIKRPSLIITGQKSQF